MDRSRSVRAVNIAIWSSDPSESDRQPERESDSKLRSCAIFPMAFCVVSKLQHLRLSDFNDGEIETRPSNARDVNLAQCDKLSVSSLTSGATVRRIVSSVIVFVSLRSKLVRLVNPAISETENKIMSEKLVS